MAESAKVEILIDAFTDAAQQAVEDVGDKLSGLSADAQPAQSAMNSVSDELDDTTSSAAVAQSALDETGGEAVDLAAAMQALQSRADEAGDEIGQAGRQAGVTSGLFSRLSVSAGGLTVAMGTLSTVATASLIPSLLTLSTVLLPLLGVFGAAAAAAGSLVAVMGGLAATGAVTHMSELQKAMKEARQEIMEIIQPLGEVFGPLLVDAVEALPDLVRAIVDSLGPLDQFAQTMRELGGVLMDVIPQATGVMFDLAQQALPILIDVIEQMQSTGPAVFDAVAEAVDRLGPPLMALGGALADVLPDLFDIGMVVGELVIPALTRIVDVIDQVAEFVLSLDDGLRRLAVAGAITAPAIFGVASSIGTLLGPLGLVAGAVAAFAAAYRANFLGIQDVTNDVVSDVLDLLREYASIAQETLGVVVDEAEAFVDSFTSAFEEAGGGQAIQSLVQNIRGYTQQVISLVRDVAAAVRPIFRTIGNTLSRNGDAFATFARMAVQALNGVVTVLRTVVLPVIRFVLMNFIIPLVQRMATVWSRHFGEILQETIETINAIRSYIRPVLVFLAGLWRAFGDEITAVVRFAFQAIIGLVGTAMDAIYTAILVVLNILQGDWGEAWNAIASFGERTLNGFIDFVTKWGSGLLTAIGNALDPVVQAVVDWGEGVWNAITGTFSDIAQAFTTFFFEDLPNFLITALASMVTMFQSWGVEIYNIFASIWNGIINVGVNALEGFINMVIDAINEFLSTLDDVADAVSQIPGVDAPDIGNLETVDLSTEGFEAERRRFNRQERQRRNEQAIRTILEVQGDNPLADFIEQQVEANSEQESRQNTRRTRRQRTR